MMVDVSTLYPIIHDLTDLDSIEQPRGCCHDSILLSPGCFSLQDLLNPECSTIPWTAAHQEEAAENCSLEISDRGYYEKYQTNHESYPVSSIVDEYKNAAKSLNDGMEFDEAYVLTREVCKGRVSTVWECVHKATGVRYAAKVVDRRKLTSRDDSAIRNEYSILKDISESSSVIVKFIAFFEDETHFYVVTEFANGGDLLTILAKRGKLNEEDSKLLTRTLLKGIRLLHTKGICHRNLKPENLLLRDSNDASSVLISDFSNATQIKRDLDGNMIMLTSRCEINSFTSPEVLQHLPYDTQVDMWSLGVIVYHVLTGNLPFDEISPAALMKKITKCQYEFHLVEWIGISRAAKRFVSNLLQTDPDVRLDPAEALHHSWLAEFEMQNTPLCPISELVAHKNKTKNSMKLSSMIKTDKSNRGKRLRGVWKSRSSITRKRRSKGVKTSKSIVPLDTVDETNENVSVHLLSR